MADRIDAQKAKDMGAILWKTLQRGRSSGQEDIFVQDISDRLLKKLGTGKFKDTIMGALKEERGALQIIRNEVRTYLGQLFPDKSINSAQIRRLTKNFAQYTWCIWCQKLFPDELTSSINGERQALKNMETIFNNIVGKKTRKVVNGTAANAIRKSSGGAKRVGRKAAEEGLEGLGKAWRAVRKFGQEVFEFVIKRAH